jgi:hypothetical protein
LIALTTLAIAALTLTSSATADKPKYRFTAAGQAIARSAVLQKADFQPGWKGGPTKPDLSDDGLACAGFNPKQSDLVTIGVASSEWKTESGSQISSQANVLQTPAMMALDWRRTMRPGLLRCLRSGVKSSLDSKTQLVSIKQIAFPRVSPYVRVFRVVFAYRGVATRVVMDLLMVGRGRTEIMISVMAKSSALKGLQPWELYYLEKIFSRMDS